MLALQGKRRKERCRDDRQALKSVLRGTWGTGPSCLRVNRIACATERQASQTHPTLRKDGEEWGTRRI